jgi:hypothetical protein
MAKSADTKNLRKLLKSMGDISKTVSSEKTRKKSVPKPPKETKMRMPKEVKPKKVKEEIPETETEAPEARTEVPKTKKEAAETEAPKDRTEVPEVINKVPEKSPAKPLAPDFIPYEGAVETKLDQLFSLIQSKGKISTDEAAAKLNVKKKLIDEWAEILCEQNLIVLTYPSIGKTIMQKKEEKS